MATVSGEGIHFYPLYWTHHDNWRYYYWPPGAQQPTNYFHYGHAHLWMMGFPWDDPESGQDAFSGQTKFRFEVEDIWGPRSDDQNQATPYRVVGTPKWYFHITELWRRVYIQPWDENVVLENASMIVGRKGIKWDASKGTRTYGPFREGIDFENRKNFVPLWLPNGGRTLPIEYFTDNNKDQGARDNYVREGAQREADLYDAEIYRLTHDDYIPKFQDPAARAAFPDSLYIHPIMEYQMVTQLEWERIPEWQVEHDVDDENFGDGWSVEVSVPFISPTTGEYKSPFGPRSGIVYPPGSYFNTKPNGQPLVPNDKRMKFRNYSETYDGHWKGLGLDPTDSGQSIQFNNPYNKNDGRWVQQCLGGMVLAKCVVTIEHKFGGRQDITVSATQLLPQQPFEGNDQWGIS